MRRVAAAAVLALSVLAVPNTVQASPAHPRPPAGNPCVAAIRSTFGTGPVGRRFIAISWRESRWTQGIQNRRAVVVRGRSWGRAAGCLQILPGVAARIGVRCSLLVARCNVGVAARRLFQVSGWSPWRVR
jgi:predicted pyridoxine 5'-phosphate oxidase superfamily flavin-nucleotide-binding protein